MSDESVKKLRAEVSRLTERCEVAEKKLNSTEQAKRAERNAHMRTRESMNKINVELIDVRRSLLQETARADLHDPKVPGGAATMAKEITEQERKRCADLVRAGLDRDDLINAIESGASIPLPRPAVSS